METMLTPGGKVILAIILVLGIGVFALRMFTILRVVASGRAENRLDHFWMRLTRALSYTFGQSKVLRNRVPGLAHLVMFYGFIVASLGTVDMVWSGFAGESPLGIIVGSSYFIWLTDIMASLVIISILVSAYRRFVVHPPEVLNSAGAVIVLSTVFLLMVSLIVSQAANYSLGLLSAVPPVGALLSGALGGLDKGQLAAVSAAAWWTHILLVIGFLAYIPFSKHMHLIVTPFNNFLHSLQPRGALPVAEIDTPEVLGAGQFNQYKWKHLLDLFACTQCGRCLEFCPSFLSGGPLAPRQMIMDLRSNLFQKSPVPDAIGRDAIWACTTCSACQEHCPVFIEHIDKIVEARRFLLETEGASPSLSKALKGMAALGNPEGIPASEKKAFLDRLNVPELCSAVVPEVVLWLGCTVSSDPLAQDTAMALVKVLKAAGVNAAILGAAEKCCGDIARRTGEEGLFQELARENIENMQRLGVKKILTTCPHCFNVLKNEYPQFGGDFEVIHHADFLLDLVQTKRIELTRPTDQPLTYHDPCYLGRYNDNYDAPREILRMTTTGGLIEMPRSREKAVCCGGGGGQMHLESQAGTRVNRLRFTEAEELQVSIVATGCPFCKTMMDDAARYNADGPGVRVKDIAELVYDAMSV